MYVAIKLLPQSDSDLEKVVWETDDTWRAEQRLHEQGTHYTVNVLILGANRMVPGLEGVAIISVLQMEHLQQNIR